MALSAASDFAVVVVRFGYSPRYPAAVVSIESDGNRTTIYFDNGWPTGDDLTKLEILQTVYASADGFQDSDGNDAVVEVEGSQVPPHVTLANMEEYGFANPLIPGSGDRWENARKVDGAFLTHASVEEDATSGRRDIVTTGGIKTPKGVPISGIAKVSLRNTVAESRGSNANDFNILVRDASEITDPRNLGLFKWLADVKTLGPSIFASGITSYDQVTGPSDFQIAGTSLNFSFDQNIGTAVETVVFAISLYAIGPSGLIFQCSTVTGSATPNVSRMTQYMRRQTADLPTTQAFDEPPIGDPDDPGAVHARAVFFEDADLTSELGKPTWQHDGGHSTLGGTYGRILTVDDLEASSFGDYSSIPWDDPKKVFNLRAVHMAGDGDAYENLRLGDVSEMVPQQGESADIDAKNDNAVSTGRVVHVDTKAGVEIVQLAPKEVLRLRVNWDHTDKREITSRNHLDRVLEVASGISNLTFNDSNYISLGSGAYLRPVPKPRVLDRTVNVFHGDTFDNTNGGTDTFSNNASLTDRYTKDGYKVSRTGRFRVECEFTIHLDASDTGEVSDGHQFRLGINDALLDAYQPHSALTAGEEEIWILTFLLDLDEDDVLTPYLRYTSTSAHFSNLDIASYRMRLDHEMHINIEEA